MAEAILYAMAMGTRKMRERQQDLWISTSAAVRSPGHAFYDRLNEILAERGFDRKVEALCLKFYKKSPCGRPSGVRSYIPEPDRGRPHWDGERKPRNSSGPTRIGDA